MLYAVFESSSFAILSARVAGGGEEAFRGWRGGCRRELDAIHRMDRRAGMMASGCAARRKGHRARVRRVRKPKPQNGITPAQSFITAG